jgi:hypothetical protein
MFRRVLGVLVAGLAVLVLIPALASAAPAWAPAATAPIHPGVQTFTDGAQCTSNFVFYDASNVYLGQAAHCSGTGGQTDTDGCTSGSLPIGTAVDVTGAGKPGVLAYNSWITMQQLGERDPNTCAYNDLALVRLDPADAAKVNPSIPHWGGPTGVGGTGTGQQVYSYGNSELRGGIAQLSPKVGTDLQEQGGSWSHDVATLSPGVPGDSGSAFLNASGQALGVLSTLELAPLPASNGVGDIGREVAYMQAHGIGAQLAKGTQPFQGGLPLSLSSRAAG